MKRLSLLILGALCCIFSSLAQIPVDVKNAAEKGDAKAQNKLAWIYYEGNANVAVDKSKAVELFSKSAIQGYSNAQSMLGYCYAKGIGTVKDLERAVFWYTKAAEQNHAGAQNNLANCYMNGTGVAKDVQKAIGLYQKSAEGGIKNAQRIYASYLLNGKFIEKDSVEAFYWLYELTQSERNLTSNEKEFGVNAQKQLEMFANNLSSAVLCYAQYYWGMLCSQNDDYFQAEKYLQSSYALGCEEAASELAWLYDGTDRNYGSIRANTAGDMRDFDSVKEEWWGNKEAVRKFRNRSHRYNNDNAEYWFYKTIELKLDRWETAYWYLCNIYADRKEYSKAASALEQFLKLGQNFNSPEEDSLRLADLYLLSNYKSNEAYRIFYKSYKTAINSSDEIFLDWIYCGLGKCYYFGKGVSLSYMKAVSFFEKAVKLNDPEGMYLLSKCYRFGRGVSQDVNKAEQLLKKAKENADPTAIRVFDFDSQMR